MPHFYRIVMNQFRTIVTESCWLRPSSVTNLKANKANGNCCKNVSTFEGQEEVESNSKKLQTLIFW